MNLFNEVQTILKSADSHDNKLEYFKREIIKILEKQAEKESGSVIKSIDFLAFLYVEKSALGVGHVSTYKDGSMWKKIQNNPPKWKCIRQARTFSAETSGAKQSITKLINKVRDCKNTDELLDIVMFNIDRFRDEKGQILPIVEKLKKEVETKKTDFAISKELAKDYSKQNAISTIKGWATQENFDKAKGKSRDEIFFIFGQKLKPIGKIPEKYLKLLNPKSGDTRVFCGKGYFIDHMVNHHPDVPLSDYEIIPDVLENPDDVRLDDKKSVPTVIFQKRTNKYGTVVVNCKADGDKVIFYKTGFTGNKESYKNKPSVVDRNPTINPSSVGGNGNVSALPNGNSNISQNEKKSSPLVKEIRFNNHVIEIEPSNVDPHKFLVTIDGRTVRSSMLQNREFDNEEDILNYLKTKWSDEVSNYFKDFSSLSEAIKGGETSKETKTSLEKTKDVKKSYSAFLLNNRLYVNKSMLNELRGVL